ncbi:MULTISPECIES: hypothetical protein [Enterobacteriaceae]|jgi:hypothetical protein|uniref:hypothetical protein n=1 Tax=Enterobacteriaceae TaxID=543 RepID=UPI0009B95B88|nr:MULTISPECIES: hypothetical protein [Enterobacteriaceae]ECJ5766548.1 hypothetical protein [Salmonella enterica]EDX3294295.1 hypothetical protein [Salmonella enterica subsp. enterica serovar Luciana]HAT7517341.1 hypothetical protein [Kluyvera ascorbata]HDR2785689.1 hypothetical protein [Enterobacter sichuanensis]EDC4998068.1 hypothetical protein [Salmonella enterica]
MKTTIELDDGFFPGDISNKIRSTICSSLEGITTDGKKFVINDKIFFRKQKDGNIKPCVMNSASYISKLFQKNLSGYNGCQGETKLLDQSFDGLMRINYSGLSYKLKEEKDVIDVAKEYIELQGLHKSAIYNLFPMFYGMYIDRGCFSIPTLPKTQHLFKSSNVDHIYTIGVEFETGNVSSSFRAINKLNNLFQQGAIDGGCFITSIDKANSATRIWPASNRNGSFQELKQRFYKNQIALPLVGIGFAPDDFSQEVGFLSNTGSIYFLERKKLNDQKTGLAVYQDDEGREFFSV